MKRQLIIVVLNLLAVFMQAYATAEELPQDPSISCFVSIPSNSRLQIIKDKIALIDPNSATLDMLSSERKPTKSEKVAISLWIGESEKCTSLGVDWRSKNYPPIIISLAEQFIAKTKSFAADLYARKISYGEFAKLRIAAEAKYKIDLAEAVQKILAERKIQQDRIAEDSERRQEEQNAHNQANEQQNDLAQRQFLNQQYLQNQEYQHQLQMQLLQNIGKPIPFHPMVVPPTINTNCSIIGNQMSCQSR
jgi:hypothetical protein